MASNHELQALFLLSEALRLLNQAQPEVVTGGEVGPPGGRVTAGAWLDDLEGLKKSTRGLIKEARVPKAAKEALEDPASIGSGEKDGPGR